MKWQIVLEVRFDGPSDGLEEILDDAMEFLVDEGIEDPAIGSGLEGGITQVEFVVEAADLFDAQMVGRGILDKAGILGLIPSLELMGESARRAELVPA